MGNGLQSFGCCCNPCELVELPCCYLPLSQYLIATAPNGKRVILSYDPTWGPNGSWIGYIIFTTVFGHPLDQLQRVELGPCSEGNSNWVLRLYCHDGSLNRPMNFTTTVDCTGDRFEATFEVPSLHPNCFDTAAELHGTWTVVDSGQLCTGCCCTRDVLVVNPGGQCCGLFADADGRVPLTGLLWVDFMLHGTCHSESLAFYAIGPSRDCACDLCDQCQHFSEPAGLFVWIVEQLPGSTPATCLIRASLTGVADCPQILVQYELDGITQAQCADLETPFTLTKVSDIVSETFDCFFPDEILLQNESY